MAKKMDIVKRAKEVLDIEAKAISSLKSRISKDFIRAVEIILKCRGRVVVSERDDGINFNEGSDVGLMMSETLSPFTITL